MLAGGAAPEVVACDQDRRPVGARQVQDEIGVRSSRGVVPPIGEERFHEPLLIGHLEEPCGDDLIGIDILIWDDDDLRRKALEGLESPVIYPSSPLHHSLPLIVTPFSRRCLGSDRKSTRLNSSNVAISYDVICL